MEQDLDALAKRIFQITMEGLTWRTAYEQIEIAYGMKKLRVGATVEDDKVLLLFIVYYYLFIIYYLLFIYFLFIFLFIYLFIYLSIFV